MTSLGERMFEQCRELKRVKFPEGLTSVGNLAFYYCSNMQLYDFPATFEEIGANAFAGTKLGIVRLNKKVKLGYGAFQHSSIAKLEMPFPTDSIPDLAFAYCSNIRSPRDVMKFGNFTYCRVACLAKAAARLLR